MKSKRKGYSSTLYFSDGCAICEFMKEVEQGKKKHTEAELKKAFDKQNKINKLN